MSGSEDSVRLPFPPVVIGIAGCSGSGKTTLAIELARAFGGVHFPLDHYYLDLSHLPPAERAKQNFDDPALIEESLLAEHIAALARGEAIDRPLYDFTTHTRVIGQTEPITPGSFLIVEGVFALVFAELLPLYRFRVYVDTPDELCFERRLHRDMIERGRTQESVQRQYDATVRPSSFKWVRPSSRHADLVIDGTDDLDWKVERVVAEMRRSGIVLANKE